MTRRHAWIVVLLPLALAACGGGDEAARNVDSLDDELAEAGSGNATDPVIAVTLQDQIMVDPQLSAQANLDAVRPPSRPYAAPVPADGVAGMQGDDGALKAAPEPSADCPNCVVRRDTITLGALAARQPNRRTSNCASRLRYAAGWANRLPADMPLPRDARVIEAAGTESDGCSLRVVAFSTPAKIKTAIDWYYTRVTAAGFTAEHQSDGDRHVLGGTRGRDDAYVVFATARVDGGTNVEVIANNGR